MTWARFHTVFRTYFVTKYASYVALIVAHGLDEAFLYATVGAVVATILLLALRVVPLPPRTVSGP